MHWKNNMSILGYNYRLTDFQSSLGISQLKKVNFLLKKERGLHQFIIVTSPKLKILLFHIQKKNIHAYHLYPNK